VYKLVQSKGFKTECGERRVGRVVQYSTAEKGTFVLNISSHTVLYVQYVASLIMVDYQKIKNFIRFISILGAGRATFCSSIRVMSNDLNKTCSPYSTT
jgi:hypothetical protein